MKEGVPNHFAGEPFSVSLVPGIEIFCLRAFFPNFLSIVFCHTVSKNSVGEPFWVSKTFGYRKILCTGEGGGEGGGIKIFFQKNLSCCRKIS